MKKIVLSVLVAGSLLATSCKEVKKGATDLKDATIETAGDAVDATKNAAGTVVDGAKDAGNAAVNSVKDAGNAAIDGAKDAGNAAVNGVKDAGNAAINGVKDAGNAAVNAAKDAGNAAVDAANAGLDNAKGQAASALGGITIPKFSNEAVTENLVKYAAYAKDYISANGNVAKIAALAPRGAELLAKGKELASTLNIQEMAKYKSVLSAIQSKMAPAQ